MVDTLPELIAEDRLAVRAEVVRFARISCGTRLRMHEQSNPRWTAADDVRAAHMMVAWAQHIEVAPGVEVEAGLIESTHSTPEARFVVRARTPVLGTEAQEAAFETGVARNARADTAG